MTRLQYLEARIDQLEATVSRLTGREFHRQDITMAEYLEANMIGDKVTQQRYLDQWKRPGMPGHASASGSSKVVRRHAAAPPHERTG